MDAARAAGAGGGTVIHARGTANKDAEKFFGISIEPEKEMVLIIVPVSQRENILHALYSEAGLQTAGQGIAFSLPVRDVVGLSSRETLATVDSEKRDAAPAETLAPEQLAEPKASEDKAETDAQD